MADFFYAELNGNNEICPVQTRASGIAFFGFDDNFTILTFILRINHLNRYRSAQLRFGLPRSTGPIVASLFEVCPRSININPGTVTGTLMRSDLRGPLTGRSLADLAAQMGTGHIFVNITSDRYPSGEIRGQVIPLSGPCSSPRNPRSCGCDYECDCDI
ncbi:CHRD domain-containing protein [Bacillus thuringiensis]|uniref:CHRD domain-containing protein n=1 Tax=Bacillus thuringiensis serovar andalousiensis TaxID=257985 RepID=A0A6H0TLG2_BACTU|nr:CHRD domain-containing protein [Bacillus thuringiensis]QIW21383.1 CHRD domain-containing protein [Bacillus thuringiensis serovar andalousiensis]